MIHQFVLASKSKGCSGRGVRMRVLSYAQRQEVFEAVAAELGAEATMLKARLAEGEEGVRSALVAVTKAEGLKGAAELAGLPEDAWIPLTNERLSSEGLEKHFTTKDISLLVGAFRKYHDVTDAELDDILGEAQALAEG